MPNWSEVLNQISQFSQQHQAEALKHQQLAEFNHAVSAVRQMYLQELHKNTNRNVIAYYSGFLHRPEVRTSITDEDKNGFMMTVHKMGKKRMAGLDLILHTEGGDIASTQSIVRYLHEMFGNDIRAIVPQIAMSAGTMIACSCKEIWMGKHSNLGPIDPQVNGMPVAGVIEEFKRAHREIKKDHTKIAVWQPILNKYMPTFLDRCENALKWSNKFVMSQLETVMFASDDPKLRQQGRIKAKKIVGALSSYRLHKTHNQHLHYTDLERLGLKVYPLELEGQQTFQDLIVTIHHCYMHSMMNTAAVKIIENHLGDAMIKHVAQTQPTLGSRIGQPIAE